MIKKITDKFGPQILKRSALNLPNGAEDMKKFMTKKPINIAVEIGTFRGITSAWMSQFCDKLYTIDLLDGQYEDYKERIGWARTPAREEIWWFLGIDNIIPKAIKDNEEKKELLESIKYDFAFIDGDHSYEGVKLDFNLVKGCKRVLFHDYDKAPGKACPVRDFIHTIKDGNIETTKDFAYWEGI